jgi:ubiquitin carboxyl-terminal hydrolase 4/11/15
MEHVLNNFAKETRFLRQHRLSVSTFSSSNNYISPKTPLNEIFDYQLIVREEKKGPFFTPSSIIEQSNSAPLELMDCLEEFLALELLEGSWFCKNQCKKEVESAARKMYLSKLPPVLIFQLKRFSEENGRKCKIYKKVTFPINGLDLSGLLLEKYATSSTPIYDLVAVSNHIGTIDGGHYTTYARLLREDQWYDFDDTRVSKLYSSEFVTNNAYLLFYVRRDAHF